MISKNKREYDNSPIEDDEQDIAHRELAVFRRVYLPNYEALAFPHLFPTGAGYFDYQRPIYLRFKRYREHLLNFYDRRFANSRLWTAWSEEASNRIDIEIAIEDLAALQTSETSKRSK